MYKVSASAKKSSTLTPTTSAALNASRTSSARSSTGRGGAGNIYPVSELPMFSFDEEMDLQEGRERANDVWHVGRGGAGNWSKKSSKASTSSSQRKNSSESVVSNGS